MPPAKTKPPTIIEVLSDNCEPLPEWLREFSPKFNLENFFSSRTVFYPGSGTDGQPIRLCSTAHTAHTFVYADYMVSANEIISKVNKFKGYDIERLENLDEELVSPNGWRPREDLSDRAPFEPTAPYYLYVVLCRKRNFNRTHGPKKLAILFIGRDGFETFDILYCQNDRRIPYLIVVQDHGFGYNFDRFDKRGLLRRYAKKHSAQPQLLLVGKPSKAWKGYKRTDAVPEVTRFEDGTYHEGIRRKLYHRDVPGAFKFV